MKTNKYKIILVAGARPNFMKIAPLMHALEDHPTLEAILLHTGQHYDEKMSHSFFDQLNIPKPQINLEVGSGSHAQQTARIMEGFETVCLDLKPDMILVVGDVNSTAACSLVAAKLHIKVAHYEAGLRSRDRTMPEEVNRLVTDAISDLYITTSADADDNLLAEGVSAEKIHMLGNLMIDSLVSQLEKVQSLKLSLNNLEGERFELPFEINSKPYAVMTFHRPSNVDDRDTLAGLVQQWLHVAEKLPVLFPIHPRTEKMLRAFNLLDALEKHDQIFLTGPLTYHEFIKLVSMSRVVITDSGGIQEETTYLKIPCLTVRPTTERPVTIWEGSNQLISADEVSEKVDAILASGHKTSMVPHYWDGETAGRIVAQLENFASIGK